MPVNIKNTISILFRIILGFIFIYAAMDKIVDPFTFAVDIRNYELTPEIITNIMALTLPWIELFCGLFLILGIFPRTVAFMICTMLIVFILAISMAMLRGLNIDCGCYHTTGNSAKIGFKKLIEDFILLFMAGYLFISNYFGVTMESLLNKRHA